MIKISEAEYQVMNVIWEKGEATSVEVINGLKDCKWNFNTVRTLIKRLELKGAIEVANKVGKAYTYRPLIERTEYRRQLAKDLFKKLYNNSIKEFILDYYRIDERDKNNEQ